MHYVLVNSPNPIFHFYTLDVLNPTSLTKKRLNLNIIIECDTIAQNRTGFKFVSYVKFSHRQTPGI